MCGGSFVLNPLGLGGQSAFAGLGSQLQLITVTSDHVGEQALDGAGPFETLRVATPARKDHVEQGGLHSPQGALARAEVLLVLEELVDKHLGANVEHIRLILIKSIESTDRQDSQEKRW